MLEFENNKKKTKDDGEKSGGVQEDVEDCRQKVINELYQANKNGH